MANENQNDAEKIFVDSIGQKATVQRETLGDEQAQGVNRRLIECGLSCADADEALRHYTYFGSAAVHIFASPILNSVTFVSQTDALLAYRCPEILASKAFDDLLGRMKNTYGKKAAKLRSGF